MVIGDYEVLRRDISPFTVLDSCSAAVNFLGILLLGLALDVWMIDDLTHGHTAQDWAKEAVLPPMAVRTVNEGQAQVTREVGPFSKQRCLVQVAVQTIVDDRVEVL